MSSYRGEAGAWDGGPPGAEADYAPQRAPPHAAPLPTTDPWTGVSYSDYGPPHYDYQSYGYGYNYDQSYYPRTGSGYYDNSSAQASQQQDVYDYQARPYTEQSRSPVASQDDRERQSYNSRSVSPYDRRERQYSRERENSYEESRRHRSRTASKTKRSKYSSSSSRSSSRSRSHSRAFIKKEKKSRSQSSESSRSNRSSMKATTSKDKNSLTPPIKKTVSHSRHRSGSYSSYDSYKSKTIKREVESKEKTIVGKDTKSKDKKQKEVCTPPRKKNSSLSPRGRKNPDKSITPPKRREDRSPQKKNKYKDNKFETPPRKHRESSITPPRSYARSHSSSHSPYRSFTPQKRKGSPKLHKSRSNSSSSSQSSGSSGQSRSKSPRRNSRKSGTKNRSRSKNRSKERYNRKSRSKSNRRSNSKYQTKRSRTPKASKSRSHSPRSRSRSSGTPSEDERRGQFTVADRKRFWKMHRSMQEKQKEKVKSPPKEVKPPPGAVESTTVDDIEYGDPPEVEGPNFADLLPPPEQAILASTSKSKTVPIPIKNDGSFLEMFKKMQEESKKVDVEKKPEIKKPVLPFIGKRRGGRVLKTGLVKKAKAIDEQTVDNTPKDAWSLYMQEVKKYRETSCEEERKTRPLVK